MKTIRLISAGIAFLMLAAPTVFAHHLWIEPAGDKWVVIRGIVSDRVDPYDPGRVREILAFDKDGNALDVERMDRDDKVMFGAAANLSMAAVWSPWGYRVNTTRGKRLVGRAEAEAEGLHVISAFHSTHYAKSIFSWSAATKAPTGLRFEIIPLENPLEASPGTRVRFRVLFDGEPLAGTTLYAESGNEATTCDDGVAVVTVQESAFLLLYARHRIDVDGDEEKDYDVFTTFLTFEVNQ